MVRTNRHKSKYLGLRFDVRSKKWDVTIKDPEGQDVVYIGEFESEIEAAVQYDKAMESHPKWGHLVEDDDLNFPEGFPKEYLKRKKAQNSLIPRKKKMPRPANPNASKNRRSPESPARPPIAFKKRQIPESPERKELSDSEDELIEKTAWYKKEKPNASPERKSLIELANLIDLYCDAHLSEEQTSFIQRFAKARKFSVTKRLEVNARLFVHCMNQQWERYKSAAATRELWRSKMQDSSRKRDGKGNYTSQKNYSKKQKKKHRKSKRLTIQQCQDNPNNKSGWSNARVRAWNNRTTKPNEYYYRFNAIGDPERKGDWSAEEHKKFMKRLKKHGTSFQWGTFAMAIPGRCGYNCSNYYRSLLVKKQIWDYNYKVGGKSSFFVKEKNRPKQLVRYGFIVLRDDTGIWDAPECHEKAPKNIKDKCASSKIMKKLMKKGWRLQKST